MPPQNDETTCFELHMYMADGSRGKHAHSPQQDTPVFLVFLVLRVHRHGEPCGATYTSKRSWVVTCSKFASNRQIRYIPHTSQVALAWLNDHQVPPRGCLFFASGYQVHQVPASGECGSQHDSVPPLCLHASSASWKDMPACPSPPPSLPPSSRSFIRHTTQKPAVTAYMNKLSSSRSNIDCDVVPQRKHPLEKLPQKPNERIGRKSPTSLHRDLTAE